MFSLHIICWPVTFSWPSMVRFYLCSSPTIHVEGSGIISVVNWHNRKCWHELVLQWAAPLFILTCMDLSLRSYWFITVVAVQSTARGTFCVCGHTSDVFGTSKHPLSLFCVCKLTTVCCGISQRCSISSAASSYQGFFSWENSCLYISNKRCFWNGI